jgi:hypothetical protein
LFGYEAFAQAPFASLAGNTFNVSIAEAGVDTSEALTRYAAYARTQAEGVEGSESMARSLVFLANIAEGVEGEDSYGRSVDFVAVMVDGANVVETLTNLRQGNVYPVGVQLYVETGQVLVWGMIDDRQTANWQNVNNSATTGWTEINNGQTPGWNQIPS